MLLCRKCVFLDPNKAVGELSKDDTPLVEPIIALVRAKGDIPEGEVIMGLGLPVSILSLLGDGLWIRFET